MLEYSQNESERKRGEYVLGTSIRRIRTEKGLTQEELKKKLNLNSSSTITNWEKGIRNPSSVMVPKIAEVLGCTIDELYEGE